MESIPDISKWDTSNVKDMSYMFSGCSSLISLPYIDNWNYNKVVKFDGIVRNCKRLENIPPFLKAIIQSIEDQIDRIDINN